MSKPYLYHFRPGYSETDQGGIIHHSAYAKWFEDARVAYLRDLGLPIQVLEKEHRVGIAVVNMNITYKKPTLFDEALAIEVRVTDLGRASFITHYRVLDGEEVRTEAVIRIAVIDMDRMRARGIPDILRHALESADA